MKTLTTDDFTTFFDAIYGYKPFPWQSMLLDRVLQGGWPDLIDLPTASGKTACIDVSIFALATGVRTPRRTWFVVDRRIVVDEAFERAARIGIALKYAVAPSEQRQTLERDSSTRTLLKAIHDPTASILRTVGDALLRLGGSQETPLEVGRLRGGVPRDLAWAGNPAQPAVLTSTIDQVGSRLLFRGYGVGPHTQPVHAAMAANDSLIVLDEAHLAAPFLDTVKAIRKFRDHWADVSPLTPFELVVMSATPPQGMNDPQRFPDPKTPGGREAALDHPKLRERMSAPKPTALAEAKSPSRPRAKRSRRRATTTSCSTRPPALRRTSLAGGASG